MEQVKIYFSAIENLHNALHEAVEDTKRHTRGRGMSGMGQAEDLVLHVCKWADLKQTKELEGYPIQFRRLYETLLQDNLGKELSRMASRQNRVRDQLSFSFHKTANPKIS